MTETLTASDVKLKRAYERAVAWDRPRILIDRLWPRGVKKAGVAIDQWIKSISPSTRWPNGLAASRPVGKTFANAALSGTTRPDHTSVLGSRRDL